MSLSGDAYCEATVTSDYARGDIVVEVDWPATVVGLRRMVRCPYAYDQPWYAYRDCTVSLNDNLGPTWTTTNTSQCPDPPFTHDVETLSSFTVTNLSSTDVLFDK